VFYRDCMVSASTSTFVMDASSQGEYNFTSVALGGFFTFPNWWSKNTAPWGSVSDAECSIHVTWMSSSYIFISREIRGYWWVIHVHVWHTASHTVLVNMPVLGLYWADAASIGPVQAQYRHWHWVYLLLSDVSSETRFRQSTNRVPDENIHKDQASIPIHTKRAGDVQIQHKTCTKRALIV